MNSQKEVYIVGDKKRLVIQTLLRTLEDANMEVIPIDPNPSSIALIPNAPAHAILCLSEETDGEIIRLLKIKCQTYGLHIYLAGTIKGLSIVEEDYLKQIPAFRFKTWPIDIPLLQKAIEWNSRTRKRILVVDDDADILRRIKSWLETDYDVYLVNSGFNALDFITKHTVDLILLDYEMPELNGPEVLRRFRVHKETARLPVIFLTSKDDRDSVMAAIEQKADGYILKTRTPAEIIKAIKDFFKKYIVSAEVLESE